MHVHVPEPPGDPGADERQRMAGYFKTDPLPQSPEDMYEKYRSLDLMAVIFSIDAETCTGDRFVGNDYVAAVAEKYPEQLIGFASVDPYPAIQPERWLKDYASIEMKDEVRQKILLGNARRLLRL